MLRILIAALVMSVMSCAADVRRAMREIGPHADWCAAVNALRPGDELRLRPGDYVGPCTVRSSGSPDAPIVVSGVPGAQRPRIVYTSDDDNVVNVYAGFVTLRRLQFGPTKSGVDAIRIHRGDAITVDDCEFDGLGGAAVVTNVGVARLAIRDNEIRASRATAVYLGCHDGDCAVDAVIERNYISGVTAPPPEIGYGIQVKLNSTAIIRDNVIRQTKGPGIMVYGSRDVTRLSRIESNFTAESATSAGIVVGGGPAIVRNNIVVGSTGGGIALEDYGHRGLLRGIVVANNTAWGNVAGAIVIASSNRVEARIVHNALHQSKGPAMPEARSGVISLGNVDCSALPCFKSAPQLDFTPLSGSLLEHRALRDVDPVIPEQDYFGNVRPALPAVGAVDNPGGVVLTDRRKPQLRR